MLKRQRESAEARRHYAELMARHMPIEDVEDGQELPTGAEPLTTGTIEALYEALRRKHEAERAEHDARIAYVKIRQKH